MYDFTIPDGLTATEFRQHPVTQLIRDSAYNGARAIPSKAELDALDLGSQDRRRIREACKECAAIHDEGHQQDAWGAGDQAAADILAGLSDEQRDPNYYKHDPLAGEEDPARLAAYVEGEVI